MDWICRFRAVFAVISLLVCAAVQAQSPVDVSNAWARATVPAQTVGGVYLEIRSPIPAKLVRAASPVAGRTELHKMSMENGVMKMSPVDAIDLPAGQSVKLAPGGLHVMLLDLKRPLKAGESVPLALTVERADKSQSTIEIKAQVRDISGAPPASEMHKGH